LAAAFILEGIQRHMMPRNAPGALVACDGIGESAQRAKGTPERFLSLT